MPREPANADAWNAFADVGRALLVGGAVVAPLWRKDFRNSFDGLAALLATYGACKAIKALWPERRPNGQNNHSFPSEHAGDCFAAAVILDRDWQNSLGPAAIGLATAISMSRVFSGKHHIADVVAGGALGIIAAEVARSIGPPRLGRSRRHNSRSGS